MKLLFKWAVSLVIAAFFVWLSFRQWPVADLLCDEAVFEGGSLLCRVGAGEALRVSWAVNLLWLLPALAVLSLVHFLRVLRWDPLLKPLATFDFSTLNRVGAVSFFAVFTFPLRLGEFARPYLISQTGRLRKSAAFGTIAVERVMDGLMMALVLGLVLFLLPGSDTATYVSLRAGALIALAVFSGALVMLIIAYFNKEFAVKVVGVVFGLISAKVAARLSSIMAAFIDGMKAMPTWRNFAQFVLVTVLYWGVNGFYYYCVAAAFGLAEHVGLAGAYAMMSAVAVGMMVPNSPANVGSFWYFLLLPVSLFGVSDGGVNPMAFALTVWGLMLLQYTLFAGYFLATGKVSLQKIWSIQRQRLEQTNEQ